MRAIVYAHLTCKLAWLSHPEAIKGPKRLEGSADDGPRAVRVELDRVLAGERPRPGKPQDERLIYHLHLPLAADLSRIGWPHKRSKDRSPRFRQFSNPSGRHARDDVCRARPGYANH